MNDQAKKATAVEGQAQIKRMNLMQLTFFVAVNMMGSGIIMLPTNMAQVGAISLLSWIVTALGSMAIAYGFAQAGLFNTRSGGLAAYAEDAYGRSGYFLTFFLYFISIAVGNVAIAISAVGYLAHFFPWLSSTPVSTCIGVIGLLWLTTVANFGGPSVTGRIGSFTVWGVILPVGLLSVFGWFWFKPDVFAAAWNPKGLGLFEGMGSSISLTLWAFLGMESAAQNSDAVEDPKRNVPLACMFGTLGAAVIYVLSTTAIQGIVPNADLAASTGPFGLAFEHMFSPAIGGVVMVLAAIACVGSLLGWQFTFAQTGKSAADERMFPGVFAKVTSAGAPIAGMIILCIAQSLLALSTISPSLSEQFSVLVNLTVVINVIPYVIALSALMAMMHDAGVTGALFWRNSLIALVAMVYSIYAIYTSGKDAVMGGMMVVGVGFVIWGLIASRFAPNRLLVSGARGAGLAKVAAMLLTAGLSLALSMPAAAGTLDRVRSTGKLSLGYRADARPLSYRDESGTAVGYAVALCQKIADQLKADLKLPALKTEWVPVTLSDRFAAVQQGKVDLLCGADSVTLARRADVSFSIPIYPSGVGAALRADAPTALRELLAEGHAPAHPLWRGSPAQTLLESATFSVVGGTTSESWLAQRLKAFQIEASISPVGSYEAGIKAALESRFAVFFGDRAILLESAVRSGSPRNLVVLDRLFTNEPLALGLARDNDDLRLIADRTLSRLYGSPEFRDLYAKWFGRLDESTATFFRQSALPE